MGPHPWLHFGPVLPIAHIAEYEEALAISNARNDGLSAYSWTQDYGKLTHATQHLQTGTIFINKGICGDMQVSVVLY